MLSENSKYPDKADRAFWDRWLSQVVRDRLFNHTTFTTHSF
jgi:hypothetical protein